MKIEVELNDPIIRMAAALVMKHYKDQDFLLKVSAIDSYNHTKDSPADVVNKIKTLGENSHIVLKSYRSTNPWSRAIAYAKGNTVYFNNRKTDDLLGRTQTVYHEFLHTLGYLHKGNFVTAYNLKSVPYRVANIFKDYIKETLESHP